METRDSLTNRADYDYLKVQLGGMIQLFEEFYNYLFFDLLIEIENPGTTPERIGTILESITRHGAHMSAVQINTLLNKARQSMFKKGD